MNVGVEFLKAGMVLGENVKRENENNFLFPAGIMLDDKKIEALKKYGIKGVKIKGYTNLNETINDELRDIVTNSLKGSDVRSVIESTNQIVSKILLASRFNYDLARYTVSNEDIHEHCLNITLFATELAKIYNEQNYNNPKVKLIDLKQIAAAAIFSQIGKTLEGKDIISEYNVNLNPLTFENIYGNEFVNYNEEYYPLYGYAMLKKINDEELLPTICKVAVLLQKENFIGMNPGPLGAKNEFLKQNPAFTMSQIINVCANYEELLSETLRLHEKPSNVIEMMKQRAKQGEMSKEFCDLFLANIPLYTIGTKVILRGNLHNSTGGYIDFNGVEAEVCEINFQHQDRPKVKVNGVVLDLFKATTVTIDRISNIDLSDCIQNDEDLNVIARRF